jgi:hypothetical protein
MPKTREEDRLTEDEIARKKLGPRGVPGAPDPAKMTPNARRRRPSQASSTGTPPSWSPSFCRLQRRLPRRLSIRVILTFVLPGYN